MTTPKISLIGYLIGLVVIAVTVYRYYFLYPDIDKLIGYTLLGISVIGIFFNYNRGLNVNRRLDYIDDLMEEYIKEK